MSDKEPVSSQNEPAKPHSRWTKGNERYPSTDGRRTILSDMQKSRSPGWRNGARVVKR